MSGWNPIFASQEKLFKNSSDSRVNFTNNERCPKTDMPSIVLAPRAFLSLELRPAVKESKSCNHHRVFWFREFLARAEVHVFWRPEICCRLVGHVESLWFMRTIHLGRKERREFTIASIITTQPATVKQLLQLILSTMDLRALHWPSRYFCDEFSWRNVPLTFHLPVN